MEAMEVWVALVVSGPSPSATRGALEMLVLFLGATKWPALGVSAGAGLIAYNQAKEGNEGMAWVAWAICGLAFGWFLGGLTAA